MCNSPDQGLDEDTQANDEDYPVSQPPPRHAVVDYQPSHGGYELPHPRFANLLADPAHLRPIACLGGQRAAADQLQGHGGARAAEYVKHNLFSNLIRHPKFISDTKSAISDAYSHVDSEFLKSENNQNRDGVGHWTSCGSGSSESWEELSYIIKATYKAEITVFRIPRLTLFALGTELMSVYNILHGKVGVDIRVGYMLDGEYITITRNRELRMYFEDVMTKNPGRPVPIVVVDIPF